MTKTMMRLVGCVRKFGQGIYMNGFHLHGHQKWTDILENYRMNMNTAICFTGTGREIEHTFDNLRENVIDPFDNRDVIVYITDTPKAKETEKYFQTLDDVYINVVKEEPLDISKYNFLNNWPPSQERFGLDRARQIYLQMLKSRSYMNDLIDQIDKKYDRVIFSRMDVIYKNL